MRPTVTRLILLSFALSYCSAFGAKSEAADSQGLPTAAFVFDNSLDRTQWRQVMNTWRGRSAVAARNLAGQAGGNNTGFAQSFVPKCNKIAAIELCVYPVSGIGYIRLDIHEDDHNAPSHEVLARVWLRIDADCPVPHYGFMPFDIPDIEVNPERKYWFTYLEYVTKGSPSGSLTNLGTSQNNNYTEGQLMRGHEFTPSQKEDARFRIIAECPPVPTLRQLPAAEHASLPPYPWANGDWREVLPYTSHPEKGATWSRKVLGLVGRMVVHDRSGAGRIGLAVELRNTAGATLDLELRNPNNTLLEVRNPDGEVVPPSGKPAASGRSMGFRLATGRHVLLPPRCYVGYSLTPAGWISASGKRGNLDLKEAYWRLAPGKYVLYGEYRSSKRRGAAEDQAERAKLWDGRLLLPPVYIRVKKDGTAEQTVAPDARKAARR